jgi:hypothetical protein
MGLVELIEKYATGRNVLLWLLVAIITGAIMSLGITPQVDAIIGDLGLLDTRLYYTYGDVATLFGALGAEGLMLYTYQKIVDMVFPLGYGFALAMLQIIMNRRAFPEHHVARHLAILPIVGMLFDYVENILIWSQIVTYPALSAPVIALASVATILKWSFLGLSITCVVVVAIVGLTSRRKTM